MTSEDLSINNTIILLQISAFCFADCFVGCNRLFFVVAVVFSEALR